jgi:hypothetical protein
MAILRLFAQMRQLVNDCDEPQRKIEQLEGKNVEQFALVFKALKQLITQEAVPQRPIG